MIVNERIKVISRKNDLIAAIIWSFIRGNLCNWRSVIVPKVYELRSVLLTIKGDRERYCFFNNIWFWGKAIHVIWIHKYRLNWFWSKIASCKLVEIEKVISPDLNSCISIFYSISWIDSWNNGVFVVSESDGIFEVWEISSQRNRKGNNLVSSSCRRVLTLEACLSLLKSCCFTVV